MSVVNLSIKEIKRLGNIVEFEKDFEVDSDNGIFHFGHITINTRDDEDEDERNDI